MTPQPMLSATFVAYPGARIDNFRRTQPVGGSAGETGLDVRRPRAARGGDGEHGGPDRIRAVERDRAETPGGEQQVGADDPPDAEPRHDERLDAGDRGDQEDDTDRADGAA